MLRYLVSNSKTIARPRYVSKIQHLTYISKISTSNLDNKPSEEKLDPKHEKTVDPPKVIRKLSIKTDYIRNPELTKEASEEQEDKTPKGLKENPLEKSSGPARKFDWKTVKELYLFTKGYLIPYQTDDKQLNKHLLSMYGLLALSKTCFFAMPLCMKHGINLLTNHSTVLYSIWYFLGYGVLNTVANAADARRSTEIATIIQDAWRLVSLKAYQHLLKLDITFHVGGTKTSLFSIHKAKKGIESNLRFMTNIVIPSAMEITIGCALLIKYAGPEFMGVFLTSLFAYVMFTRSASKIRRSFVAKQKEQDKILDFIVTETLSNYFLVKHFNAEKIEVAKFETVLNKYSKFALENANALGRVTTGQRTIIAIGLTVNLILGVLGVYSGAMTPGDLVMVQTLMVQVFSPLNSLGVLSREFLDSYFEIRELFNIMEKKPKIVDKPDAKDYEYKGGELTFQNVSFSYVPERPLIKNLTLTLPAKKIIALCGESGTGKSTLYNLLFRFYDPDQGDIYIDGQNLKDLKVESFRDKIGVVSQQPVLFNDTVYNNLLYANPKATFEEIQEVCKKVGMHNTIMQCDEGYNTLVGDQGAKFSGGERQRLSIARCMLKDPPIVLLDEITSALDARNENQVMEIVDKWRGKKTIIYITHRMHLNDFADQVVMLKRDGGVELGDHESLIQNPNSKYYELWLEYLAKKSEDSSDDESKASTEAGSEASTPKKTDQKTESSEPKTL